MLVQEQLQAGHIRETMSPWNTPIFVILKRSGKWHLSKDLREVNKTMQIMGSLQPGLPSPTAILWDFQLFVLDLKDAFFTIPLHPDDWERFAFSVPSINYRASLQRYCWRVLPQGMANSPALCQKLVDRAIFPIREQYPTA